MQYANNFLPLLTMPVIARIIGPEKFGLINFAASFITYFSLVINYGFDLTATREIAKQASDPEHRNRVFSEVISAKILLFILSSLIFFSTLFFVPIIATEKALYLFTYLSCFALVMTPNWLYQGMQDSHQMAIFHFISKVLFTASILFVVKQRSDYVYQPLILSLSQVLVALLSFFWAVRRYSVRIRFVGIRRILTLLFSEKMIFFSMVVGTLNTTTNTMVLGLMQTATQVGYYTVGWKLITIMQTFVSIPLLQALFPYMGESFGKSHQEGIMRIRQLAPFISFLTIFACVFIWITAPYLVRILYGAEFDAGISVLRILSLIPLIQSIGDLFGIQTMINLKMDKPFFNIKLLGFGIGLILNIVFSKYAGANGTAVAWVLTELTITCMLWGFLYSRKIILIDFSYFRLSFLKQMASAIITRGRSGIKKQNV